MHIFLSPNFSVYFRVIRIPVIRGENPCPSVLSVVNISASRGPRQVKASCIFFCLPIFLSISASFAYPSLSVEIRADQSYPSLIFLPLAVLATLKLHFYLYVSKFFDQVLRLSLTLQNYCKRYILPD